MANGLRFAQTRLRTHLRGPQQYGGGIASKFNQIEDFEGRMRDDGEFLDFVFRKYCRPGRKTILNLGAGGGATDIGLLRRGNRVLSVDGNAEMLGEADKNARRYGVPLLGVRADWKRLSKAVVGEFDVVTHLGNGFAHSGKKERESVIRQIQGLLKPSGLYVVDYRNYQALVDSGRGELPPGGYYFKPNITITYSCSNGILRKLLHEEPKVTLTYHQREADGKPVRLFSLRLNAANILREKELFEANGFAVDLYSDGREGCDSGAKFYQLVCRAR